MPGEFWRVNFSRVEWQVEVQDGRYVKQVNPATGNPYPEDNWVWSPQGIVNMHYPELWGYVVFADESADAGGDPPGSRCRRMNTSNGSFGGYITGSAAIMPAAGGLLRSLLNSSPRKK